VSFTSPEQGRWRLEKDSPLMYVFGMEMWTEEELRTAKAKLGEHTPAFLHIPETVCSEYSLKEKSDFRKIWNECGYGFMDMSKLKRTELFGMQARTYFADPDKMRVYIGRLIDGFSEISSNSVQVFSVMGNKTTVKASYRFLNLCYEPRTRFFYNKMPSFFLGRLVMNILKGKTLKDNFNYIESIRENDINSYGSSFERMVSLALMKGSSFYCRDYWETSKERIHFSSCGYEHFSYSVRNKINVYENLTGHPCMVRDRLTESVMLVCEKKDLATVDQIVLRPPPEDCAAPIVEFFKCTTSPGHAVSPYSFFSMILLILSLKDLYGVMPVVRFIFAVPSYVFYKFESAEVSDLDNVWPMEVKVVDISYSSYHGSVSSSPETSSPSNGLRSTDPSGFHNSLSSPMSRDRRMPVASSSSGVSLSNLSPSDKQRSVAPSSSDVSLSSSSSLENLSRLEIEEMECSSNYVSKAFHLTRCQLCEFIPTSDVNWDVVGFQLSRYFVKQEGDKNALEFFDPPVSRTSIEKEKVADILQDDGDDVKTEFNEYYDKLYCTHKDFYPHLLRRHTYDHHLLVKCVLNNISHKDMFSLIAHLCLNVHDIVIDDSTNEIRLMFANEDDLHKALDFFKEMLRDVFVIQSGQCLLFFFLLLFL
jgi:hypothetical protein